MASPTVSPPPRRHRSAAGPVVLIVLGIVFLLTKVGVFTWRLLFVGFAQYWPVLLILWGVVKLIEYYRARNAGYTPSGIGVGGFFLLLIVILVGLTASVGQRVNWNALGDEIQWDHGQTFPLFGSAYDYSEEAEHPIQPGDTVNIISSHGDITVSVGTEDKLKVIVKKRVGAENQRDADKLNQASHISISQSGNTLTVTAGNATGGDVALPFGPFSGPSLRADLEIYLPRKAAVGINTRHGDVKVAGRDGDVDISDQHGGMSVSDVSGNVKLIMSHGDATVSQVHGNVEVQGRASDVSISDVSGTVSLNGDFFGDTTLARIGKVVRFDSSRTQMEMGSLSGELKMNSGDLNVSSAAGGFRIRTRSKDIHLEDVAGDVEVENSNADVELHAGKLPLGNVAINNHRGPIQVYLPPQGAFQVEANSRGGEIHSDFSEVKIESSSDTAKGSGSVGIRGKRVQLTADHGDIDIRKG